MDKRWKSKLHNTKEDASGITGIGHFIRNEYLV